MIAHICCLSLRHKASIQANSYRLPYARRSYGSLTYLRQKLRRCLQLPLPRKKRLLQLCPDISGTWGSAFEEQNSGWQSSGAVYSSRSDSWNIEIPDNAGPGYVHRSFRASRYSGYYGASGVSVDAAYVLMIIKA